MKINNLKDCELYHKLIRGYDDYTPEILFILDGADFLSNADINAIKEIVKNSLPASGVKWSNQRVDIDYVYDNIDIILSGRVAKIKLSYTRTDYYEQDKTSNTGDTEKRNTTFYMCRKEHEWYIL